MLKTPPWGSPVDDGAKSLSFIWMQWFTQLYNFLVNAVVDYSNMTPQVPLTGFSISFTDGTQALQLDPVGTLASGTITMAPNPKDGQLAVVATTATITSFALSPNAGQSIKNAPTTLLAGTSVEYYYNASKTTWYRLI